MGRMARWPWRSPPPPPP
uniref:Uncharacterized protein n=1 Tax=Arundo donax TaxID=35708 RepID=A0A0A8ZGP2_ARUDO